MGNWETNSRPGGHIPLYSPWCRELESGEIVRGLSLKSGDRWLQSGDAEIFSIANRGGFSIFFWNGKYSGWLKDHETHILVLVMTWAARIRWNSWNFPPQAVVNAQKPPFSRLNQQTKKFEQNFLTSIKGSVRPQPSLVRHWTDLAPWRERDGNGKFDFSGRDRPFLTPLLCPLCCSLFLLLDSYMQICFFHSLSNNNISNVGTKALANALHVNVILSTLQLERERERWKFDISRIWSACSLVPPRTLYVFYHNLWLYSCTAFFATT